MEVSIQEEPTVKYIFCGIFSSQLQKKYLDLFWSKTLGKFLNILGTW